MLPKRKRITGTRREAQEEEPMKDETLPAKRLEHAQTKLQDALSALKLAGEELAIVEASMIGDDAHRRLIMESSRENPIGTADDIQSHRVQAAEIAEHAADVAKAAKAVKGKATFIAAALGSVYQKEILDGDREREKKDKQAKIKWDKTP